MKEKFNPDFYIAVATVVPLLYITLFLQGQLVQDFAKKTGPKYAAMSDYFSNELRRAGYSNVGMEGGPAPRGSLAFGVAFLSVLTVLLAGPVAVGYSVWALFFQGDVLYMRVIVMLATFIVLLLVSFNPTVAVLRNFFSSYSEGDPGACQTESGPHEESAD
jgi:hypothetical protein